MIEVANSEIKDYGSPASSAEALGIPPLGGSHGTNFKAGQTVAPQFSRGGICTFFSPLHSMYQNQCYCNHTHHPCTPHLCWFPIAAVMNDFFYALFAFNSLGLLFIGLEVRSLKWVLWGYSRLNCCLGYIPSRDSMGDSFLGLFH